MQKQKMQNTEQATVLWIEMIINIMTIFTEQQKSMTCSPFAKKEKNK